MHPASLCRFAVYFHITFPFKYLQRAASEVFRVAAVAVRPAVVGRARDATSWAFDHPSSQSPDRLSY
ncbi:hypothetical protein SKAU_G00247650 [Synaphobranchus kaupii]|uniref:Uncharacterized protein n=1 Tax=Synaphobranchus kaupii TaxID=118154 RepID=A0A9Q1F279_SYNKA|nr:hypothetical protein SKAU_G00247650 [Synaphobranchus kaupii]